MNYKGQISDASRSTSFLILLENSGDPFLPKGNTSTTRAATPAGTAGASRFATPNAPARHAECRGQAGKFQAFTSGAGRRLRITGHHERFELVGAILTMIFIYRH